MAYTIKQLRAMTGDLATKLYKLQSVVDVLGESNTGDTRLRGIFTSRNVADTSMYVPVDAASTTPYGLRYAIDVASSPGLGSGYLNAAFFNARASSDGEDAITGTIRGGESKATVYQCNMGDGSYAEGLIGKVSVSSSPAQVDYGIGVHGYVENSGANTSITNAYGFLAEAASPLSKTLSSAFGAKDVTGGVFMYGLDLDACTGLTADIRGMNGETIKNTTDGYWDFGAAKVKGTGNHGTGAGMSTPLLNTAFGTPTVLGAGFRGVYTNSSDGSVYLVGTNTVDGWFAAAASPVSGS
jgi:hypothetical protein